MAKTINANRVEITNALIAAIKAAVKSKANRSVKAFRRACNLSTPQYQSLKRDFERLSKSDNAQADAYAKLLSFFPRGRSGAGTNILALPDDWTAETAMSASLADVVAVCPEVAELVATLDGLDDSARTAERIADAMDCTPSELAKLRAELSSKCIDANEQLKSTYGLTRGRKASVPQVADDISAELDDLDDLG